MGIWNKFNQIIESSQAKFDRVAKSLIEAVRSGSLEEVRNIYFSDFKALQPGDAKNELHNLALFEAASYGNLDIVRLFADHRLSVDWKHPISGVSPIGIAAFGAHDEVVRFLAHRNADVNAVARDGTTPLMLASARCSVETVSKLLEKGADPGAVADGELTALDFALRESRKDIVNLLQDAPRPGLSISGNFPGIDVPDAYGGKCIASYVADSYRARLYEETKSIGPIEYPYILAITDISDDSPVMYITAETMGNSRIIRDSPVGNSLREMISNAAAELAARPLPLGMTREEVINEKVKDILRIQEYSNVTLGVFSEHGHDNLGEHHTMELPTFVALALKTMSEKLATSEWPTPEMGRDVISKSRTDINRDQSGKHLYR